MSTPVIEVSLAADKVAAQVVSKDAAAAEIPYDQLVMAIAAVILAVLKVWQECKKPAPATFSELGPASKLMMELKVRHHLRRHKVPVKLAPAIAESILTNGATATTEQLEHMAAA